MSLLKYKLKRYQAQDIKFLIEAERACVFNVPGSGKTPTALGCFQLLSNNGYTHFIVVAEPSLLYQWRDEIKKFTDLQTYVCKSLTKSKRDALYKEWADSKEPSILVIGYTSLRIDYADLYQLCYKSKVYKKGALVYDEAAVLSNNNQTSLNATHFSKLFRYVYALTATPVTTSPVQFHKIFKTIGVFPLNKAEFIEKCCQTEEKKLWQGYGVPPKKLIEVTGIKDMALVKQLYGSHYIRRTRKDIAADFTEKQKNVFYHVYPAHKEQQKLIKRLSKEMFAIARGEQLQEVEGNSLTRYLYFKQTLDMPWLVDDINFSPDISPKIDGFMRLLDTELSGEEKIFCFAQFKRFGIQLANKLNKKYGANTAYVLNGDMNKKEQEAAIQAFVVGSARFLIATSIAERGLNLQVAHNTIFFDLPSTVSSIVQIQGRTDRVGQESPILNYYFLLIEDSIEYKIFETLRNRAETFDMLLEDETFANFNLESDEFIKTLI